MLSRETRYLSSTPPLGSKLLAYRKARLTQSRVELRDISVRNFPIDYPLRRANRLKHRATISLPAHTNRPYLRHPRYDFRILFIDHSG